MLGFLGWVRFATKHPAAAMVIIIFFAEDCFDIFNFGIRKRFLSDVAIMLMLPLIVLNLRKVWNHITTFRSAYTTAIILFFCALLISLYFGSHVTFGQPMGIGLVVARKHLLFCSYLFMVAVGASRKECFLFLKYLALLGAVVAILSIVEVVLGGGIIFSNYYAIGQERAGRLRIHVGTFLVLFSIVYSFIKYQHLPNKFEQQHLIYLIVLFLGLYTIGFIVMTRADMIGLFFIFILWFGRKKLSNNKIMLLCATVSIIPIFFLSGLYEVMVAQTFIGKIIEQTITEFGSNQGNISIREDGAKYFLNLMLQNAPLTGIGIFSDTNFPNNPVTIAAKLNSYYLVDNNGLTTFIFFGFQGVLLLLFFVIKPLRDSSIAMKYGPSSERDYFEILFFIFIFILVTPTLNNIIVERMLVYSGVFFYLLSQASLDIRSMKKKLQ